jgi:hypothetical protein
VEVEKEDATKKITFDFVVLVSEIVLALLKNKFCQ